MIKLHQGDCREVLAKLPAESVQTCVTSPPYYGLRAYLPDGHPDKASEIGLEQSPAEYVAQLVDVFREVRRVLRTDGCVFLNLGDSYAGSWGAQGHRDSSTNGQVISRNQIKNHPKRASNTGRIAPGWGLKPKDLMLIPARVAIALQDAGWWIRSEIIWSKSAPMPESVRDRPTCAHEKVWLLTKASTYFYDADAVKEQAVSDHASGNGYKRPEQLSKDGRGDNKPWTDVGGLRNLRNVWHLNPEPFPGAHFATMPATLAERCIKAGTSERGCCPHCGAPWSRDVERLTENMSNAAKAGTQIVGKGHPSSQIRSGHDIRNGPTSRVTTLGWSPSCACPERDPVPCTVLDPFAGAGTTLLVADRLQRHAVGIELNTDYCDLIRKRLAADAPLLSEVA